MSDWNRGGYRLTAAGRRLQAKVEAGAVLVLTRMKLGNGTETAAETDSLTDLVSPQVDFGIISAEVSGETCAITGNLLVNTIANGFWCREWGVFAEDPDDGEILYAIALDAEPDWIPAGAEIGTSITYTMNIAVANATEVSVHVDVTGLVDASTLIRYTHSCTRQGAYQAGDTLNAPTLPHGLVLECITGGSTSEVLVDFSQAKAGDEIVDGEVVWQAKKLVTTSVDDNEHTIEWLHDAIAGIGTVRREIMIPAAGWQEAEGAYKFNIIVNTENVRENTPTQIIISPDSQETASLCGLSSVIDVSDGSITLHAKAKPSADIHAELMVFVTKGGGGGGGADLPIATESTLGAVKIGNGLNVRADGTLSIDTETVLDDADMANEEEVQESVRKILEDDDLEE